MWDVVNHTHQQITAKLQQLPVRSLLNSQHCAIQQARPHQHICLPREHRTVWCGCRRCGWAMWLGHVAERIGYSAGFATTPTHVGNHTLAPRSTPDFMKKTLAKWVSHISYCMFTLLLNWVSVLLSECVKSLIDDESTFVNSLLRRGHFYWIKELGCQKKKWGMSIWQFCRISFVLKTGYKDPSC